MARLNDLESVILGIVAKFGPCTAYVVRTHFESSPAHFFSSSPGSVYPAIRRLQATRELSRRASLRGKQKRSLYTITARGRSALHTWVQGPYGTDAVSLPYDALRTRMYFLATLPRASQLKTIDAMILAVEQRMPKVRAYIASFAQDPEARVSHLAASGCMHAARAQLHWLREVRREFA